MINRFNAKTLLLGNMKVNRLYKHFKSNDLQLPISWRLVRSHIEVSFKRNVFYMLVDQMKVYIQIQCTVKLK